MNTAIRVAVRAGLDLGHTVLAVKRGFRGLPAATSKRWIG